MSAPTSTDRRMNADRTEKAKEIEHLRDRFTRATSTVILDFTGVDVEMVTALRVKFRERGVDYRVAKNTLVKNYLYLAEQLGVRVLSMSTATRVRPVESGYEVHVVNTAQPRKPGRVLTADHVIEPVAEFHRAVHAAEQLATEFPDSLLTFGIPPSFPSTGYGYIEVAGGAGTRQGVQASRVAAFVEKPDEATAETYVAGGRHLWNAGIFVWKPGAVLGELRKNEPGLYDTVARIADAWGTPRFDGVFRSEYEGAKKISIDYAVMQEAGKAGKVLVLHAPYQWDDVGSWLALERRNPQDAARNTVQGLHVGVETAGCVIVSDAGHLVGTLGVQDLIIIQNGDATLVATKDREGDVKKLVDAIKATGLGRYL